MKKIYTVKSFVFISILALLFFAASCKKNPVTPVVVQVSTATPTSIGLYKTQELGYKFISIAISKIGTVTPVVPYYDLFDTGSGGLVIDADSLLPSSMITSSGFVFSGDSIVVNGITITNQTSIIEYGADDATTDKVYGNLAYAPVTIGDENGSLIIKRLPFFLYYKAVNGSGSLFGPHEFDTFGAADAYDVSFANGINVTSPFSSFDPGTGLTRGFKMAALGTTNYTADGEYAANVLTLGLTASDLSSSSGFGFSQISIYQSFGYLPLVNATVTCYGTSFSGQVLFDTGTTPDSYLEDPTYTGSFEQLPTTSSVSVAAASGFNYYYIAAAPDEVTYLENPNSSGGLFSIIGFQYFFTNEYMLDFTDHTLGLKIN